MNNYQNVLVYNSFLIHLGSVSFNNADYVNLLHKNFDKWGCGQILGPCYFKLVPDFACTP